MKYNLPSLLDSQYDCLENQELIDALPNTANIQLLEARVDDWHGARCYNYVFGNHLNGCNDADEILKESYHPVGVRQVEVGDVVAFYRTDHNINRRGKSYFRERSVHFGIVDECSGTLKSIRIKSKWGLLGIFKTDLQMLPNSYGDYVIFYRKDN